MSYGYQGPPVAPFPGQKPPTSFGLPPGTPSAPPSAPPYSQPPTSFGMPQPFSPYPTSFQSQPQPPQSSPYPNMGGQSMPLPQSSMPYPGQSFPPSHPGYGHMPTPQQQTYPPQQPPQHQPYPMQPQQPYPSHPMSQPQQPYPSQPQRQSYPSQPPHQQPYPSHPMSQPQQPYPSQQPHNPSYNSGSGLYPNLSGLERPDPTVPPMQNSGSSPYQGGGYSRGQGNRGSFSYGGSAPYSAAAPRKTPAQAKLSPTVVATPDFDPRADAEILRKAMKGFGTDEKALIQVLANRTNLQRQEIEIQFKTLYGKELVKDLKSETSGNFEKLLVAMMRPLPQYYAKELHDAMSGIGTDECVLIEVLCTMSNHEIRVIKQAYEAMYGTPLEEELRSDTSGNFERLMVSLCCANRDESFEVDPAAAANDARELLQAGELRFGTDESVFNAILVSRNAAQLRQIFAEYQNITGHDIEQAIENEFSGDVKKGLLAIVKCVKNRAGFFAEQLYKSMKGAGTNDRRLIRLVVTRSEIDMGEIKQVFQQMYGESLEDCISGDCSGHYKKCLLALIN
ncbi:hypothetical protein TSAR_001009 [Trichomalopsis sarcophagae]|uniref:Annexin n=1 Tax=Trichomalopsis sarcophagae TaxID=543379 RepID=A0A232EVH9_9HYME|nr:hypothetical protein TSAR_001009 [Trichomalopsis sarcophagae]